MFKKAFKRATIVTILLTALFWETVTNIMRQIYLEMGLVTDETNPYATMLTAILISIYYSLYFIWFLLEIMSPEEAKISTPDIENDFI